MGPLSQGGQGEFGKVALEGRGEKKIPRGGPERNPTREWQRIEEKEGKSERAGPRRRRTGGSEKAPEEKERGKAAWRDARRKCKNTDFRAGGEMGLNLKLWASGPQVEKRWIGQDSKPSVGEREQKESGERCRRTGPEPCRA